MKKVLSVFALIAGVFFLSASSAYAVTSVPTISGTISPATEWDDSGFAYYLSVNDPNEAAIPDAFDIKRVVIIEEKEAAGGDGVAANDGVYVLVETWAAPTLADPNGGTSPFPSLNVNFDFLGDGGTDYVARIAALNPAGTVQSGTTSNFDTASFNVAFGVGPGTGAFNEVAPNTAALVYELYLPSAFNDLPSLANKLIATIEIDNGNPSVDNDVVKATLTPEPGTMFLLGSGLLSLFGFRRFRG